MVEPRSLARRTRAVAIEVATTLAKATIALAVFGTMVGGYAAIGRKGEHPSARLLPNEVQSRCALWFVGSSSMSRWTTLERDMAPWVAHNRAIGGATLEELSARFANERSPKPPRAVVFYAGENDLAYGVPLRTVIEEFETLLERKTAILGSVPLFFISVKPSPTRLRFRAVQSRYNAAIRAMARGRTDFFYVDIVPDHVREGRLGPFYEPDGIHLNSAGYEIWTRAVRRALAAKLPAPLVRSCERQA